MQRRIVRLGLASGALMISPTITAAAASARAAPHIPAVAQQAPTTPTTQGTTRPATSELPLSADASPAQPDTTNRPSLPVTGVDVTEAAVVGAALVGAGALVLAARRRAEG